MNWEEVVDDPFPLPDGWIDAWTELRLGESGCMYASKSDDELFRNHPVNRRFDCFVCPLRDFKISNINIIGTEPLRGFIDDLRMFMLPLSLPPDMLRNKKKGMAERLVPPPPPPPPPDDSNVQRLVLKPHPPVLTSHHYGLFLTITSHHGVGVMVGN